MIPSEHLSEDSDFLLDIGKQYALGSKQYERNCHLAVEYFLESSKRGNIRATFRYALALFEGMGIDKNRDLAQDIVKGIMGEIKKRSDDSEIPYTQVLADAYSFGLGVTQNLEKAKKLYAIAAEAGNIEAQCSLAFCYRYAMGCEENPIETFRWWKISAECGYPHSQCDLGQCYQDGYGTEKDLNEAFKWYRKSANNNYPTANSALAGCYLKGKGTEKNLEEAKFYFKKSIDQDYKRGCRCIIAEGLNLRAFLDKDELVYDETEKILDENDYQIVRGVVYINNRIKEINIDCMRCDDIVKIIVELDNHYYCSIDGSLYNKEGTELLLYPRGRKISDFTRPKSLKKCSDPLIVEYEKNKEMV